MQNSGVLEPEFDLCISSWENSLSLSFVLLSGMKEVCGFQYFLRGKDMFAVVFSVSPNGFFLCLCLFLVGIHALKSAFTEVCCAPEVCSRLGGPRVGAMFAKSAILESTVSAVWSLMLPR